MSNQYRVEKNITIPDRGGPDRDDKAQKYPFNSMLVDDSFFVPVNNEKYHVVEDRIERAVAQHATGNPGFTATTARVTENAAHGVRVWRTN